MKLEVAVRVSSRVAIGVVAVEAAWMLWTVAGGNGPYPVACDYIALRDAAARWLGGGGFYLQSQLIGPFATLAPPDSAPIIMYPPMALWLFVPFVFLPAILWWAIPLGLAGWALWRIRPAPFVWPFMVALAVWPAVPEAVMNGNPAMWAFAFGCVAVARGWTGPLILFKPTLAPFALLGAWRPNWWLVFGLILLAVVPLWTMWLDYVVVVQNARPTNAFLLHDYPLMLVPVMAWIGSAYRRRERADAMPMRMPIVRATKTVSVAPSVPAPSSIPTQLIPPQMGP